MFAVTWLVTKQFEESILSIGFYMHIIIKYPVR